LAHPALANRRPIFNWPAAVPAGGGARAPRHIDEKLFLETYAQPAPEKVAGGRRR
jgi:hypothetical protein